MSRVLRAIWNNTYGLLVDDGQLAVGAIAALVLTWLAAQSAALQENAGWLLLALVLNRGLRGLDLYRAIFYIPSLLGASVAIAILWRQLFSRDFGSVCSDTAQGSCNSSNVSCALHVHWQSQSWLSPMLLKHSGLHLERGSRYNWRIEVWVNSLQSRTV